MYKVTLTKGYKVLEFLFENYDKASCFMREVMESVQGMVEISIEKVKEETEGEDKNESISD